MVVQVSLKNVMGTKWFYSAHGIGAAIFDKVGSELDRSISFELPEISEAFYSNPYDLAARILETIYFSSNWGDLVDSPAKLELVVDEGFIYCGWPPSDPPKP